MTRKKTFLETLEEEDENVSKPTKTSAPIKIVNNDVMLPRSKSRYVPQFR